MNMADANVFVDHFPEAPAEIEEQLVRVFGGTMWTDGQQRVIEELTRQYCEESRVLAKKCAGENEWRSHLFLGLLQPLNRLEPEILMLSASEKREYSFNFTGNVQAGTNCILAQHGYPGSNQQHRPPTTSSLLPSPRSFNRPQHSLQTLPIPT